MTSENEFMGALEIWRSLETCTRLWAHDDWVLLRQHEPFAGLDVVRCAGCAGCDGAPWEDCPVIDRIAAAFLGGSDNARYILNLALHSEIERRIDSSHDRAAGMLPGIELTDD